MDDDVRTFFYDTRGNLLTGIKETEEITRNSHTPPRKTLTYALI